MTSAHDRKPTDPTETVREPEYTTVDPRSGPNIDTPTASAGKRATHPPLGRRGYALRFLGLALGLVAYGGSLGVVSASLGTTDPTSIVRSALAFIFFGNLLVGTFFVYFTYRRALDCQWGQNGKAWIAAIVALPTLALPQFGILVFGGMMLFKSANDAASAAVPGRAHQPVQAAE